MIGEGTHVGSKLTRSTITFCPARSADRTEASTSCRLPDADSSCEHRTQPGHAVTSALPNVVFPEPGSPTSTRRIGWSQPRNQFSRLTRSPLPVGNDGAKAAGAASGATEPAGEGIGGIVVEAGERDEIGTSGAGAVGPIGSEMEAPFSAYALSGAG